MDREKRLNVRIEQLTKLAQTLTEKVVDLEFRSKSENEAIARKSPLKRKQMKLRSIQEGRQKYPVVRYGARLYPLRVGGGTRRPGQTFFRREPAY